MRTGKFMPFIILNNDIAQNRKMKLFTARECTVKVGYPSLTFEIVIQVIKNHNLGIIQIPEETGCYPVTVS